MAGVTFLRAHEVEEGALPGCEEVLEKVARLTGAGSALFNEDVELEDAWKFWLDTPDEGLMVEIGRFETEKGFDHVWDTVRDLPFPEGVGCNLFLRQVKPSRGDRYNSMGGSWVADVGCQDKSNELWHRAVQAMVKGSLRADDQCGIVVGAVHQPGLVEIWVDGGFIASEPGERDVEASEETLDAQLRRLFPDVPSPFVYRPHTEHDFVQTANGLFRPKRAIRSTMSQSPPRPGTPPDEADTRNSLFSSNIHNNNKGTSNPPPPRQGKTYTSFPDNPFGSALKPEPAAAPAPAPAPTPTPTPTPAANGASKTPNVWEDKKREVKRKDDEEKAKRERRLASMRKKECAELQVTIQDLMRKLFKVAAYVDQFTQERKELEGQEEPDRPVVSLTAWADDVETTAHNATDEANEYHRQVEAVTESTTVEVLQDLKASIELAVKRQYTEAQEVREICCDLLTQREKEKLLREREVELARRRKEEQDHIRRRAANTGLSSLITQTARHAQEKMEEETRLKQQLKNQAEDRKKEKEALRRQKYLEKLAQQRHQEQHVSFALPNGDAKKPEAPKPAATPAPTPASAPVKRAAPTPAPAAAPKKAQSYAAAAAAPMPASTSAPASTAPQPVQESKEQVVLTQKQKKQLKKDNKPVTPAPQPIDSNLRMIKEKMEAEIRDQQRREKAERKKVEQAGKRLTKQRVAVEVEEGEARVVVEGEFAEGLLGFEGKWVADVVEAEKREVEGEKRREEETLRRQAVVKVRNCVAEEEIRRLQLRGEEEDSRDVLKKMGREVKEVVRVYQEKMMVAKRKEDEKEAKRIARELEKKREEDRKRRQEEKARRVQEEYKKKNSMTSLVEKCKPTLFDAFGDEEEEEEKPVKQVKKQAKAPAQKSKKEAPKAPEPEKLEKVEKPEPKKKSKKPSKKAAKRAQRPPAIVQNESETEEELPSPPSGPVGELKQAVATQMDFIFGDNERMLMFYGGAAACLVLTVLLVHILGV